MVKFLFRWVKKIGILTVFFLLILKFSGCVRLRDSPRKIRSKFEDKGFDVKLTTLTVDNKSLHFVSTSRDSLKPYVVFVHGSPGSLNNYYNSMFDSTLRSDFEMISIDRPGFGFSDFGRSVPSLSEQARIIKPLLDSLKSSGRKVILVGHSYGGPLVGQITVMYPEIIDALVIVAGSIDPDLEPKEWWRKPANSIWVRWILPQVMVTSNQEILALKNDLENLKSSWKEIKKPVLVIQGEKDILVDPANADFAEKEITSSRYFRVIRVPGVNHFIPFQQDSLITQALTEIRKQLN